MKTIAAISTATAPGGIGIIRISGEDARVVGDRVFKAVSGEKLIDAAGYTCRFGHVYAEDGTRLDECIATVFAAPKSFTGEDVVELSCHGGLYILKAVLQAVFAAGAYPAQAGEFTRRAFMNGKMDLAQAEAVMQLISAQGREAMKAAQAGHDGVLSRRIGAIRDDLTDIGAHLSAWADYPDDDVPQVDENMLKERLSAGCAALGIAGAVGSALLALHSQNIGRDRVAIEVFFPLIGQNAACCAQCCFNESHNKSPFNCRTAASRPVCPLVR